MSFIVREARIFDIWRLSPAMSRADLPRYGVQLARSQSFALIGDDGEAFAAGGLYVDATARERICWMLTADRPPARDLLTGVRMILDHSGPGFPLVAHVDMRVRRNVRFAEALGFVQAVSSAAADAPSLPAHVLRMERRA